MKKISLVFLILPLFSFSQKRNKNDVSTTSLDSIVYDLTPKTLAPSGIFFPFKSIEILDARFDTSKLGYQIHRPYENISYKDFKRIKLTKGIQESIRFFYNDYYSLCLKDTINKLLVVLKTLWIDNAPVNDLIEETGDEIESVSISFQNIHVKWEYYIQRENKYYPFKRVDTIYQLTEPILKSRDYTFKKNDLSFFMFVLKSQLEQINFTRIGENYENKRSLTLYSIDSFNKKRFLLPVISSTNIKKGVFQTFSEFKNNTPGIDEYELKKKDKGKFWINRKNSEVIKDFYLLSDSIGIHTGSEKRISVVRVGNTFEFFDGGVIPVSNSLLGNLLNSGSIINPYPLHDRRFSIADGGELQGIQVPRQINMETGKIY